MSAQTKAYLDIKFEKNGHMDGSPLVKKVGALAVDKMIEVSHVQHLISAPVDAHSGQKRGRRTHAPMTFLMELENACVPLLYQALCSNDTFSEGTFHFHRTNAKGESEIYQTIKIAKGGITHIELVLPNVLDTVHDANIPAHLKVGLSYMQINWDNIAKKSGMDTWEQS